MRSVLLVLIIFTLAVSTSFAEKKEKSSNPSTGFKKEKVVKMSSGKFSRIYLSTMHKARNLELGEEKQKELNTLRRKYYDLIAGEEKKSRILKRTFMKQLEYKEYNPSELRKLSAEIQEANLKATDSFIEGLTKLQEVIGAENFAKLYPISKVSRNVLIQMREEGLKQSQNIERAADKTPKSEADNK